MKKLFKVSALTIALGLLAQQQSQAWINSDFAIGLKWHWMSGGNSLGCGLVRDGQPYGPDIGHSLVPTTAYPQCPPPQCAPACPPTCFAPVQVHQPYIYQPAPAPCPPYAQPAAPYAAPPATYAQPAAPVVPPAPTYAPPATPAAPPPATYAAPGYVPPPPAYPSSVSNYAQRGVAPRHVPVKGYVR